MLVSGSVLISISQRHRYAGRSDSGGHGAETFGFNLCTDGAGVEGNSSVMHNRERVVMWMSEFP